MLVIWNLKRPAYMVYGGFWGQAWGQAVAQGTVLCNVELVLEAYVHISIVSHSYRNSLSSKQRCWHIDVNAILNEEIRSSTL